MRSFWIKSQEAALNWVTFSMSIPKKKTMAKRSKPVSQSRWISPSKAPILWSSSLKTTCFSSMRVTNLRWITNMAKKKKMEALPYLESFSRCKRPWIQPFWTEISLLVLQPEQVARKTLKHLLSRTSWFKSQTKLSEWKPDFSLRTSKSSIWSRTYPKLLKRIDFKVTKISKFSTKMLTLTCRLFSS